MGTLLGTVFGYLLRGTTGSEGFEQMLGSAREVGSSREFQNLVQAAKSRISSGLVGDVLNPSESPVPRMSTLTNT